MFAYLFPIRLAALTFLALSTIITVPYMFVQYRKYGSVSPYRTVILFSFALYMLTAYYLIILPLPDPQAMAPMSNILDHVQLIPFYAIVDLIAKTPFKINDARTYLPALKNGAFLVLAFNIALTLPFGIYLGYYFKKNLKWTLILTFLLSLFYEISQITALFGLYPRPYRLFDVDDLITNVIGGLMGFLIYKHLLQFLPSRERIDEKSRQAGQKVGYIRRFFAFAIDYALVDLLATILFNLLNIEANSPLVLAFLFVYILLSQCLFKQTIGKRLVFIKLALENEGQNYRLSVLKKYLLLFVPLTCASILELLIKNTYANGIYAVAYLLVAALITADLLFGFRKNKTLFCERLSKTKIVNTLVRKPPHG
jgi:glycopeptide antibiotics resistance protein